jgi:hypothetical protein
MTGEFTAYCNHLYYLVQQLFKRQAHLQNILDQAPLYTVQTDLSQVDAIISYYRGAQAASAEVDETLEEIKGTERTILLIMQHFGIPSGRILTGQIPGELEYEVWANEKGRVFILKIRDLEPEPENPNAITIKLSDRGYSNKKIGGRGKR